MTYIVRIVGPAGRVTWLEKGAEVELQENAEHFPSMFLAELASQVFNQRACMRWAQPPVANAINLEDL